MQWLQTDVATLQAAYAAGEVTPSDLVALFLNRTVAPEYAPVWISQFGAEVLTARAKALEVLAKAKGTSGLPLYGVLVAVKDNIDVLGLPTTAACPAFSYEPEQSAAAVLLLEQAGAIIVGKTNLDQFATGLGGVRSPYGEVPNAFDPRYLSGGSSSGSAVAVAQGQVHLALGTDTAGSGRVPAALNNLVGLKPSRGLISTAGLVPACRSLDCISILARTVSDAVLALGVMTARNDDAAARKPEWSVGLGATRPRVAIPRAQDRTFHGDTEAERSFEKALEALKSIGATLHEVDFSPFTEAAKLLYDGPFVAERLEACGDLLHDRPEALDPVVAEVITKGRAYSALDLFSARHRISGLAKQAAMLLIGYDALAVPSVPTVYTREELKADPIGLNSRLGTYTASVNLLDLCALAVPTGFRSDGLPAGITLIAPALHDLRIAQLGQRIQQALRLPMGSTGQPYPATEPIRGPLQPNPNSVRIAVVGAHLSGMPLNGQLIEREARLLGVAKTAPQYRLYRLRDSVPPKPGLLRAPQYGASIDVELWELPLRHFGSLVAGIPSPLGIGSVVLEDGSSVPGFLCEPFALEGATEITQFGGWKNYLSSLTPLAL